MARGFKFKNNSKEVKQRIKDANFKGITKACLLVEGQAKMLAPVDLGNLRDNIMHKVSVSSSQVDGVVGSPTEYAEFQEYGTRHMSGKPFLRPAFRENKGNIERILGQILSSSVGGRR